MKEATFSAVATAKAKPVIAEREDTRGNLALVLMMPISFAMVLALIIAFHP